MHSIKARLIAGFLFCNALLSGCALIAPQTAALKENRPAGLPAKVELTAVPFFPQEDYYCGPSALAMVLNAAGVKVTPEDLVDQVYLPGRKGSLQVEMLAAARRRGLVAYELAPAVTDMLREVAAGTPAIVLENYGPFDWFPVWHYSVVVGYDLDRFEVIRRSGVRERRPTPLPVFEKIWKHENYWAMVALPPDRTPATASEQRYTNAVIALEKSGQFAAALTAYGTLLKRWPDSLAGQMGRGNTAYALKDFATAESAFSLAAASHPDSAAALNNLASIMAERGKLQDALAAAERAVALGGSLLAQSQATLTDIREKSTAAAARAAQESAARAASAAREPPPAPPIAESPRPASKRKR
jgi:hypothetical protein